MRVLLTLLLTLGTVLSPNASGCEPGVRQPQRLLTVNGEASYFFGDLNGDGRTDIVTTWFHTMTALLDRGGAFEELPTVVDGSSSFYPIDVIHDQNGDGFADIVARKGLGIQVRPGRGDGTFAEGIITPLSQRNAASAHFTHMNDDALLDVMLVFETGVGFSHGRSDGTFSELSEVAVSSRLDGGSFHFGDFDGNGTIDVFHVRQVSSEQSRLTLLAVEPGPAVRMVQLTLGRTVDAISVVDTDGNGRHELLLRDGSRFLLADSNSPGAITLSARSWTGVPDASRIGRATTGDVTGDGRADLLLSIYGGWLLLQGEPGGFRSARGLSLEGDARLLDVTRDGILDLVSPGAGGVTLIPGGAGIELHTAPLQLTESHGSALRAADMNRDGLTDLVLLSSSSVEVLTRTKEGLFRTAVFHPLLQTDQPDDSESTPVLDWNGDGYPDIAVTSRDKGSHILLGNGSAFTVGARLPITKIIGAGQFNGRQAIFGITGSSVYAVTAAGNSVTSIPVTTLAPGAEAAVVTGSPAGPAELLISDAGVFPFILRNVGSSWDRFDLPPFGGGPFRAVAGNLDDDGGRDLILFNQQISTVLLADSTGQYREATVLSNGGPSYPPGARNITVIDFDRDGLDDIASFGQTPMVLRNLGGGSFAPMFALRGNRLGLGGVAASLDADGLPDLALLGSQSVTIHSGACGSSSTGLATRMNVNGETTTATLVINAHPVEPFGVAMTITKDGQIVHRDDLRAPHYSTVWTSAPLTDGLHVFEVILEDSWDARRTMRSVVRMGEPARRRGVRH